MAAFATICCAQNNLGPANQTATLAFNPPDPYDFHIGSPRYEAFNFHGPHFRHRDVALALSVGAVGLWREVCRTPIDIL